jgi:glycosyltransferase involved in cell wall biosynthesis
MAQIKTILLLQDLLCGGTQRHCLELAKRLDPAEFSVEIWTLTVGGDFEARALDYGLTVRRLGAGSRVTPAGIWGLWRALRREEPEVLLAFTVVPNIWGRMLSRLAKVPVVVANCRGGDDLWRQYEGLLKNLAHHHVCNSQALKKALTKTYGLPESRVSVIPTGVDVDYFAPVPGPSGNGPMILCPARLAPIKDHASLIAAFELAGAGHALARLRLLGDGPLRQRIERRIERSPLKDRIELVPGCADPREHYGQASVVALSSLSEGMPNVILEAMAMGLPTVATAVGGVPELVSHGRTGFLALAGDVVGLAQGLDRLLASKDLRRDFGLAGRQAALAEHSLDEVAKRHAGLVLKLVRQGRGW